MKLYIGKSFKRKINVDGVLYIVHQNQEEESITIKEKNTEKEIYCCSKDLVKYNIKDQKLIDRIFKYAHIDRYVIRSRGGKHPDDLCQGQEVEV